LFALDLARLHGRYTNSGRSYTEADPRPRIPIVTDSTTELRFRFEPALMTPTTDSAAQTMRRTEHAAVTVAAPGVLREQCLLIVDNRRAAHSRSPFIARFDGSDRWLRRMMIGRADTGKPGVVERHDLELTNAWHKAGAVLDPVPYGSLAKE
jgi:L-asparagine oxygenase